MQVDQIQWWHQVPLKDGTITPGKSPVYRLERQYLFDRIDFRGKSVLDIGCWDGYFSFAAEQRGATRVLAIDNPKFRWGSTDGFEFLRRHFQSSVEWREGSIFALPDERFDVVLCYGVLYHLNDPLTAAINCFQNANERVAIEGLIFEDTAPRLFLLGRRPWFGPDRSNFYTMSTGYLNMIAEQNGFRLVDKAMQLWPLRKVSVTRWRGQRLVERVLGALPTDPARHRGAMLFERVARRASEYPAHGYSLPPQLRG
jgi:tRNA (mo5U34)-methyltransferase